MTSRPKNGFQRLALSTLAVIATSLQTLLSQSVKTQSRQPVSIDDDNVPKLDAEKSRVPKLVLKMNGNMDGVLLAMHTSHRSHSSHSSHYSGSSSGHSSHASHTSHASHYSGSPSYNPSPANTVPYPSSVPSVRRTPAQPQTERKSSAYPKDEKPLSDTTYVGTVRRVLKKGCEGNDVRELQALLLRLSYDVVITGYFGDQTEAAVKKFQQTNSLAIDGVVGQQTFSMIKLKVR